MLLQETIGMEGYICIQCDLSLHKMFQALQTQTLKKHHPDAQAELKVRLAPKKPFFFLTHADSWCSTCTCPISPAVEGLESCVAFSFSLPTHLELSDACEPLVGHRGTNKQSPRVGTLHRTLKKQLRL